MKTHSVSHNFIMNMILKISSFVFPLITFPYVSRILGADGNGKILFAASLVSYFSMFAYLGIPTHGVKICAQCRDDKVELSRTAQELIIISSVTTIIAYIALVLAVAFVPKLSENRDTIMVCSATLVLTSIGVEWFYQAIEQYDYITYRNILFKFISVVLMFLFVKKSSDVVLYAGISVLGTAGSNILNIIRLKKYIYVKPMKGYNFRRHMGPAITFFLLSVSTVIYTNLDAVMLGFITTDTEVGYYNAAIKIKNILAGVITALGTVLLPRISHYVGKKYEKEFKRVIRKSFQFTVMMAVPLSIYFVMEAKSMILFLAGIEYEAAALPMMIITPTIFFIGLSNITGIQILVPLGKEKYTVLSTVCGAVIDIVLNLLFIPRWGAAGAAVSTLVAEIVVLLVQVYCLRNMLREMIDFRDILKVIIVSAIAAGCLIIVRLTMNFTYLLVSLIVTAVVFFGVEAVGLILLKEEIVDQYFVQRIANGIRRNNRT